MTTMRHPRRSRPRGRLALLAGLIALITAAGGTSAGWAYWTAQATASGTATTTAVGVAQAGFAAPATTSYTPSALSSTRVFTVTNTSGLAGTATAAIASPEAYASKLAVRVWQVASAAACTDATAVPGSGVTVGTWASVSPTVSLAAGATATLCVRTTIADWRSATDPAGGQSVNPVVSVSLSAQGWTATAPTATHVQRTAGMYPLVTGFFDPSLSSTWFTIRAAANNGLCMDVSGSGGSGTAVLTWGCHSDANQRWQFVPVSGSDQSLVTIRPRHASTTRVETSSTGSVTIQTASGAAAQQWYVQQVSAGASPRYQLVSASTGKCLPQNAASGNTGLVTVECDSAQAQLSFQRETLTMSGTGSSRTLTWGTTAGQTMTLVQSTGATWTAVATIAAGSTSVSVTPPNGASTTYRIVFGGATSTDVAFGPFVLQRSGSTVTAVSGLG